MLIGITQTTRIGRIYRTCSEPLKVKKVKRASGSGKEYTTTNFSCDVHNMGTHIDVMSEENILETERLIADGIKFDVTHITNRAITLEDLDLSLVKEGVF